MEHASPRQNVRAPSTSWVRFVEYIEVGNKWEHVHRCVPLYRINVRGCICFHLAGAIGGMFGAIDLDGNVSFTDNSARGRGGKIYRTYTYHTFAMVGIVSKCFYIKEEGRTLPVFSVCTFFQARYPISPAPFHS